MNLSERPRLLLLGRQHQEWQVRITVQYLLANLLRDQPYDLDLRGATLIEFDLTGCAIGKALFHDAQFIPMPKFMDATFHDEVWFFDTSFGIVARMGGATFRVPALAACPASTP